VLYISDELEAVLITIPVRLILLLSLFFIIGFTVSNSLFPDLSATLLNRLQHILNAVACAARAVIPEHQNSLISPLLEWKNDFSNTRAVAI
jgi:hypothetical protein